MNILIEIGHPAHVHFFLKAITRLKEMGNRVTVVTRNKEITNALLDRVGIEYTCLSTPAQGGKAGLFKELLGRWWAIVKIIRKNQISLVMSISGISTSLPARLTGIRNLNFTDTEDASISNLIAFPFSDAIFTPQCFLKDLGRKHRRYMGLHELAYLQDYSFEEGKRIREEVLKLPKKYSIIRKVALDALHDTDVHGISEEELQNLIRRLESVGEVFITSQSPLPERFLKYKLNTQIEYIHPVLEGAQIFIGESPTMAVESSILGTPAFLISDRVHRLGNMIFLEKEGLLKNFLNWKDLESSFPQAGELPAMKAEWAEKAKKFREEMPKMSEFILNSALRET